MTLTVNFRRSAAQEHALRRDAPGVLPVRNGQRRQDGQSTAVAPGHPGRTSVRGVAPLLAAYAFTAPAAGRSRTARVAVAAEGDAGHREVSTSPGIGVSLCASGHGEVAAAATEPAHRTRRTGTRAAC